MTPLRTAPYRTPSSAAQGELREKGSRFRSFVEPCADRSEAEQRIAEYRQRYEDATHVCWAWRLFSEPDPGEAVSDAGEPSGTAGVPMLGALQSGDLWNVLGVVVRSFGGTKLGRGGLVRAYRRAMAVAIENAEVVETLYRIKAVIRAPIGKVGEVHRLLSSLEASYGEQTVEGSEVEIEVSLPARDSDLLQRSLLEATQGEGSLSFAEETTG
jgi:uncharacterized YigZ family protein